MKVHANCRCRDVHFEVDEQVYVRLRPYHQLSISGAPYNKLTKRFYGLYRILEKLGHFAYCLDLPFTSKIHIAFHCSLLKPHKGPLPSQIDALPPMAPDHHPIIQPLTILQSKQGTSSNPPQRLVLAQQLKLFPKDSSCEKQDDLAISYHLEENVDFSKGDIDSTTPVSLEATTKLPLHNEAQPKRIVCKPIHYRDQFSHYNIVFYISFIYHVRTNFVILFPFCCYVSPPFTGIQHTVL